MNDRTPVCESCAEKLTFWKLVAAGGWITVLSLLVNVWTS